MSTRCVLRWIIVLFCTWMVAAPVAAQGPADSLYLPLVERADSVLQGNAASADAGAALVNWEHDQSSSSSPIR